MANVYVERRAGAIVGYSPHPIMGEDGQPLANQEIVTENAAVAEVSAAKANLVPTEVWAGAMIRALNVLGILAQIEGIVAASNDVLMQKLWTRAAAFRRDDPMITTVGTAAGWSSADLDDLFRLAGSFNT